MGVLGVFNPAGQCWGKKGYRVKAEAKSVSVKAMQRGFGRMRPYRCPHCDLWHVGHKPQIGGDQ